MLLQSLLIRLAVLMVRFLAVTLRLTVEDHAGLTRKDPRPPVLIAFWHNRSLLMAYFYEKYCSSHHRGWAMISNSRDGAKMSEAVACFGFQTVRGSSSKGGVSAAKAAATVLKDPVNELCISPDGPRGPVYTIRPGIIHLAQISGRPIVTTTFHADWKWELQSWDRFQIPLPFSRVRLVIEAPIVIPPEAGEVELKALAEQVRLSLGT